jgi:hypothetical protein
MPLDPEANFVYRLAHFRSREQFAVGLAEIESWPRLLQVASDENAVIALRDHLKRVDSKALPPGLERFIAICALDRKLRMQLLEARLEECLAALNTAGIDVMLLKGGALACTVYGSFSARPMRDIDLLVRPDQADDARALMLERGWRAVSELPGDGSYGTHHHLPPLCDTDGKGLRLEIHRSLLPCGHPFRFTDEEIWRAARCVDVGDSRALVMHPVHHAVHIAIHFAWSHMLKMGAWHAFRDLAALTAGTGASFDWDALTSTASRWGASGSCYWTLELATALADLVVPSSVLRQLQPPLPAVLRRPLMRHFAKGLVQSDPPCPSVRLDQTLWTLAMQPRRDGHGDVRPWSVSVDLVLALTERTRVDGEPVAASPLLQMRRSSRYLSALLA